MVQEARIDRRLKLVPFAGSQYCFVVVRVGRRLESALRKHRKCYVYTYIKPAFMPNEMEYAKQVNK